MAGELVKKQGYAVKEVCSLLELARSSYYYQRHGEEGSALEADLQVVAGQHPVYGTRRLTQQLRRKPYSYQVNRKRIQRLARKHGLLRPGKRRKVRTTNSQHPYPRHIIWSKTWLWSNPSRFGSATSPMSVCEASLSTWRSSWIFTRERCAAGH